MGITKEEAQYKKRQMRKDTKRDFIREMSLDERLLDKIMSKGYIEDIKEVKDGN